MNPDKVSACSQWPGLFSKLFLNSVCPQYSCPGKRWVWAAGESAKKGLRNGPEGLMLLGRKHPFASRAAMPGQRARGMQGCLSAHGPGVVGSRHSPVRGYRQQLCQGLVTHTHYIYIFMHMYANFNAWTELPSSHLLCTVWNVLLCRSQNSHAFCRNPTRAPFQHISRGAACADPGNRVICIHMQESEV